MLGALDLLPNSTSGAQPVVILTVGGDGLLPYVPAQEVRVGQTRTPDASQTCSLGSVLRAIVRSAPHIHSNLKENTLLEFVKENQRLVG